MPIGNENTPRYIQELELLRGVEEVKGNSDNPKIMSLYKEIGHGWVKHDETPWCAAAVNAALKRGGYKYVKSLGARDTGDRLEGIDLGKKPERYAVGVMWRNSPNSWEGHIGFVMHWDADHVWLLGGNQRNGVNVQKYPRSRFLKFIRPVKQVEKPQEMAEVSRKARISDVTKKLTVGGGIAATGAWQFLNEVKEFAQDNVGIILLGGAAVFLGVLWLMDNLQWKDYKEGRYTPSGE